MRKRLSFAEVLEAVDKLTLDEQESIVDILNRRVIEQRRRDLAKEVKEAQNQYQTGKCRVADPEDIVKDILA